MSDRDDTCGGGSVLGKNEQLGMIFCGHFGTKMVVRRG